MEGLTVKREGWQATRFKMVAAESALSFRPGAGSQAGCERSTALYGERHWILAFARMTGWPQPFITMSLKYQAKGRGARPCAPTVRGTSELLPLQCRGSSSVLHLVFGL